MGKGEIARPQCFQKACFPGVSKGVIEWEWVNVPLFKGIQLLKIVGFSYGFLTLSQMTSLRLSQIERVCR